MPSHNRRQPILGAVEWFRPGEHERVDRALDLLDNIGVTRLRTGVSWADYHRPEGQAWYDFLLPRLARRVEVLPCFVYTPPSLGIVPKTASPPRDTKSFADFLDLIVERHGSDFEWVELWNEANNLNDWDWRLDHDWLLFSDMIGKAAYWMKQRGRRTVLGGMCPTDVNWLRMMCERDVIRLFDVVGVHGFPGTWDFHWEGWTAIVESVRATLRRHGSDPEVWITETGYSDWRHDSFQQIAAFRDALAAPVERVYWYSLQDLDPEQPSQEGFHVDQRHYHLGLAEFDGTPKLLYRFLARNGIDGAGRIHRELTAKRPSLLPRKRTVITGGAGFVGVNLADRLAGDGQEVVVYDNLSRAGVEDNLAWLLDRHPHRVAVEVADIRDPYAVREVVRHADHVFHLAAQVAVTSSLRAPEHDLAVNGTGTLQLLEAMRQAAEPPSLVFASTNKVYGDLAGIELEQQLRRYVPCDPDIRSRGIDEAQRLELRSPYGCSKGAAEQYVLDYARTFGLAAAVFRMSCTYGPHQRGNEDQGWVAHFLVQTLTGREVTVYGDGRQVRDLLHVEDLVEAFLLARRNLRKIAGRAFNIGGGPANSASLIEVLDLIAGLHGDRPQISHAPWRPGDQLYYVSDTTNFRTASGWSPKVRCREGIERLYRWFGEGRDRSRTAVRLGAG